jgi:hypothetical protein
MQRACAKALSLVPVTIAWFLGTAQIAHAYLDPGSSSVIIQVIIGSVLSFGVVVATFWRRIRRVLSSIRPKKG